MKKKPHVARASKPRKKTAKTQPISLQHTSNAERYDSLIAKWAFEGGCTQAQMRESLKDKLVVFRDDGGADIISLAPGVAEALDVLDEERAVQAKS